LVARQVVRFYEQVKCPVYIVKCIHADGPGGMHKGGGSPSCGGSRGIDACQRSWLAGSVPAAWGEPARPGFPPQGETGKGGFQFLAAAGYSHYAAILLWPKGCAVPRAFGCGTGNWPGSHRATS